jgi:hypothetical protein
VIQFPGMTNTIADLSAVALAKADGLSDDPAVLKTALAAAHARRRG